MRSRSKLPSPILRIAIFSLAGLSVFTYVQTRDCADLDMGTKVLDMIGTHLAITRLVLGVQQCFNSIS
jgi:hypothetical protein